MNYNTKWNIEEVTGYKPLTTFWTDFNIAEAFGVEAIKDTYNRAFTEWRSNVQYLTELVMVLNWKLWYFYNLATKDETEEADRAIADTYSRVYNDLWEEADLWCGENLKGEDAEYYYRVTD